MNKSVLVVHGSPRKNGNSSYLAQTAVDELKKNNVAVEELFLRNLTIAPCMACDGCRNKKAKYCVINDDMAACYEKILNASAILLASPIYWFTYTAQLKLFIDRCYGVWNWHNDVFKDKKIGIILVYGDSDPYSGGAVNAIHTFEHMFKFTQAEIVDIVYGTAWDEGDAAKDKDLIKKAQALGKKLSS